MKRNTLLIVILSLILSSCTEEMVFDPQDFDSMVGISGSITDEYKYQEVVISRTSEFYSEAEPVMVSGAKVFVHDNIDTLWFAETDNPGHYLSTQMFAGTPERTYYLNVELSDEDGNKQYHAQSTMRSNVEQIDSVAIKKYSFGEMVFDYYLGIYPYFQTLYEKDTYYMVKVGINDRMVGDDTFTSCSLFSMEGMSGIYFNSPFMTSLVGEMPVYTLYQNDSLQMLQQGDTLSLYLYVIPPEYASYISCTLSINGTNPMLGASSNVPSNIYPKDNSVGFFHAASLKKHSIIY